MAKRTVITAASARKERAQTPVKAEIARAAERIGYEPSAVLDLVDCASQDLDYIIRGLGCALCALDELVTDAKLIVTDRVQEDAAHFNIEGHAADVRKEITKALRAVIDTQREVEDAHNRARFGTSVQAAE